MPETFRVMQQCETGEETCAHTGSEASCEDWITNNADQYEESSFWIEPVEAFSFF